MSGVFYSTTKTGQIAGDRLNDRYGGMSEMSPRNLRSPHGVVAQILHLWQQDRRCSEWQFNEM
jgi:hypothetical protein